MKKKIKVVTVVGTRPEIIRLSSIIKIFDKCFDHKLIFTGQNFSKELSNFFFKNFKIKPDIFLKINNLNQFKSIGDMIVKIEKVLDQINPDCFFVLGDTNSALTSIVAKKKKIPVFHYEAGNRCFDERVPEETNRRIVDAIADINITYSETSKLNLIKENVQLDRIYKIGSPLFEVFKDNQEQIKKNGILKKLKLKYKDFILLSLHREENVENFNNLTKIINSINFLTKKFKKKIIFSVHPRTESKIKKFKLNKSIEIYKPFDFFSYNKLQSSSFFVLSDSGSISEESYILNFPALIIREAHERHEAMESGLIIMSDLDEQNLLMNINNTLTNFKDKKIKIHDYEQDKVSLKIVNIISSYVHYINKKIYFKI
jgi:UDP-N-acetylglucosamine 2-epimerase